ncbi:hypothetical protein ACLKA6_012164 [Drosophila palustris]
MSKRGAAATGTSLREYAAAENRLLDFFSPLEDATATGAGAATTTTATSTTAAAASVDVEQMDNALEVDPSRDNMLPFISDDSELHSLLSSSESSFKGFDDTMQEDENGAGGDQTLIFGVCRNPENVEQHLPTDNFMGCTTSKRVVLSPQTTTAPVASTSEDYMLTNGDEEPIPIEDQHVIEESSTTDCVIYDDNVVLLTDDQCCEIIVQTDQELEHAYLVETVEQQQQQQQPLNNGVSYDSNLLPAEEVEEPTGEQHVYLSDAAMVLEQQQQLLLDAADEETPQVSDSYVDDICEVYDDELEEHDDECVVEELQLQEMNIEQPEEAEEHPTILIASDGDVEEPQQQELTAAAVVPHSSTTEFPVSSTSMPNASDYDDYDADVGTAEEQSPPHPRKYGLLKNTLSAEAMDRRLANICQSQPQMSVSEKLANWNCAPNCDVVEDVENFEAEFEEHEAKPAVQPKFNEFYDKLRQSMTQLKRDLMQRSASIDAQDTPYSSEDVAMQKRPNYRRLLQLQPEQQTEPIVLDDDDEYDDDCIEVQVTPSIRTLVPPPESESTSEHNGPENVVVKTSETQTISQHLQSKETSTTDLSNQLCMPPPQPTGKQESLKLTSIVSDAMLCEVKGSRSEEQQQQQQKQEQAARPQQHQQQHEVLGNSLEYHKDAQFYEQHEFCNYLGLTELATANAVANAMRELANSTVARRSLRVRTQQQLDRMRSDVRGKRRQKEKREQLEQQEQEQQGQQEPREEKQLISESSSSRSRSRSSVGRHSHGSSNRKSITGHEVTLVEMTTGSSQHTAAHMPPPPRLSPTAQTIEYYYHSPAGEVQPHPTSLLTINEANALSLEAAFAKVYAAAAPAQSDLHEAMQNRLRQARETKPSIYIVKSLNNSAPAVSTTVVNPPPERTKYSKTPEPIVIASKLPRKLNKKTPQKTTTSTKRRRTTAGGAGGAAATIQSDRELITRSMNSKMLRNRKVNMLKTFELADVVQNRNKQRLSGGSAGAAKRLTSKLAPKKAAKKPEAPLSVDDSQQHRLDPQQQSQPSPSKSKSSKASRTPNRIDQQMPVKRKRFRAKSLPTAFNPAEQPSGATGDANMGAVGVTPESSPMQPKLLMDTHEFITNHAVVSPPLYSAAVRRYVNAVRGPKECQLQQQHLPAAAEDVEQQHSPPLEGFFDLTGSFAQLPKPALIYPPFITASIAAANVDKVSKVQMTPPGGLLSLTQGSTTLPNPLAGKNGKVLYIYYELEQLIVLQERVITFWKYSQIFNVLQKPKPDEPLANSTASQPHPHIIIGAHTNAMENKKNKRRVSGDSENADLEGLEQRWVYLGGTRRTTNDMEVAIPYANRICAHNSTPVYIEMRSHPLDHHRRESKLLSLYVNVYYYCEEELRPKMHSVHLDAVNCEWNQVIYTSIAESRYFVMAWQQEIAMGKPRAGICKYSLTPTLDTLASIREFKQLRHELKHIECLTEDRLIGYGQTRITIWDHRSGDTLMNYDLGFKLGRNLGVMHFPSFEMDQSSLLVLYQHVKEQNKWPELRIIACELSHATPSHRVLHVHRLPSPQFDCQLVAINTGDHLILKSPTDDEIWISITDPRQLTYLAPQGTQRFYTRQKSQVIIMTPETLTVDSIANHVLQLATQHQQMMMKAAAEMAASTG